jgi:ATP-dependent Clp protease ATP-binding subunit ClpA
MEVMETIVEKFVLQLEVQLAERHVAITLSPEARSWLARKGYDQIYGARPLARVVQKDVRDPLTDEILFGKLENGGTVTIGVDNDKLAFSYAAREPQPQDAKTQDAKTEDAKPQAPKTQDSRPKTH